MTMARKVEPKAAINVLRKCSQRSKWNSLGNRPTRAMKLSSVGAMKGLTPPAVMAKRLLERGEHDHVDRKQGDGRRDGKVTKTATPMLRGSQGEALRHSRLLRRARPRSAIT